MSKTKISIKLNDCTFEIISRNFFNDRDYVKIKSIKGHEARVFYVYSSRIVFGIWKVYYNEDDEYLNTIGSFENLVSNLLCFELQKLIEDNFLNIPIDINMKNEIKRYTNSSLTKNLFDPSRLLQFKDHNTEDSEYIYSEVGVLGELCLNLDIKTDNVNSFLDILEKEEDDENKTVQDHQKLSILKEIKNELLKEFNSFKKSKSQHIYKIEKTYKYDSEKYMLLDGSINKIVIENEDTKYNVYYINYNYNNFGKNIKYTNLKFIIAITPFSENIDQYGVYTSYHDNLYNKLNHIIYDDETFFDETLIDNIRTHSFDNIVFVGNISDFNFKL